MISKIRPVRQARESSDSGENCTGKLSTKATMQPTGKEKKSTTARTVSGRRSSRRNPRKNRYLRMEKWKGMVTVRLLGILPTE